MLNLVEQQLVGPNGGQPLSFQNDVFGPLGDRITVISDFKKPIKEDSQRMLVAVSLEDTKAFQNTLSRLLELDGRCPPETRVSGHDDLRLRREHPQSGRRRASRSERPDQHRDRQGHAVHDHRHDPARAGAPARKPALADSASFQSIAKEYPEKASGLSYVRPDESARLSYDLVKSGKFEKAIQQAAAARGRTRDSRPRASSSPATSSRISRSSPSICRSAAASARWTKTDSS